MERELSELFASFSHDAIRTRPADLERLGLAYMHRVYRWFRPLPPATQFDAPSDECTTRNVNPYAPFIQRVRCKLTIAPPPLTASQIRCQACVTDATGEVFRVEALGERTRVSLRCPSCLQEWIVERLSGPPRVPLF